MAFQFFGAATREDWLNAFNRVKDGKVLKYYRAGFHNISEISPVNLEEMNVLDVSGSGISVLEPDFYVLMTEQQIRVREILMYNSDIKYAIDRYANSSTFIFRPGGTYLGRFFVLSEMSSVWDRGGSVDVAKRVISYARRHWHQGNGFWIGPDCFNRHHASHLFTDDYRSRVANNDPLQGT